MKNLSEEKLVLELRRKEERENRKRETKKVLGKNH
jgi:hypothetical protein